MVGVVARLLAERLIPAGGGQFAEALGPSDPSHFERQLFFGTVRLVLVSARLVGRDDEQAILAIKMIQAETPCLLQRRPTGFEQGAVTTRSPDVAHGSQSEEHTSELQSLRHLVCRLL